MTKKQKVLLIITAILTSLHIVASLLGSFFWIAPAVDYGATSSSNDGSALALLVLLPVAILITVVSLVLGGVSVSMSLGGLRSVSGKASDEEDEEEKGVAPAVIKGKKRFLVMLFINIAALVTIVASAVIFIILM